MPTLLKGLRVTHISLVGNPANGETIIWKSASSSGGAEPVSGQSPIVKSDDKRMVYGLVYCPGKVDSQGEYSTADEIEKAAYEFMRDLRGHSVDTRHDFICKDAFVAESWLTKGADSLFPEAPVGSWAVGIRVDDDTVWGAVKKGELKGLSLAGFAQKVHDETGGAGLLKSVEELLGRLLKREPAEAPKQTDADGDEELARLEKALEPLSELTEELARMTQRIEKLEKQSPGLQSGKIGGEQPADMGGIL